MEMTAAMRELAFNRGSSIKLRDTARQNGMVTLLEDGVRKIFDGLTSLDEVATITHREDITY